MARLDIYWSFRSPYSHLAIDRLVDISRKFSVETHFRPVRPLAMREPNFFERGRPQFLPYLFKDVLRESERLGVPFGFPRPDPIKMDMASGKVDPDQPILNGVMRLAIAAIAKGKGLEFAQAVSKRIWGGAENWCDAGPMAEAAAEAGLDLASLQDWAASHEEEIRKTITESEAEQLKHHWGVPLMVLDEEPFFGQDRLDSLVWRLEKLGLRKG
ncbi:MAG TPA: DsbA family protein [Parvularculaceae bacterium]|nr:DsbA family protein [Parvularculaceae bacterium]